MKENTTIASVVTPHSFQAKLAFQVRTKIYRKMEQLLPLESIPSILDVGVTPDSQAKYSNFFEFYYPHPERITAVSDQDAACLETLYPGLQFSRQDGRNLSFADNTFELVFSSAVIEHVGGEAQQMRFLQELLRVSRRYVFLTTPNRYHLFELHTSLPLLHWLPKKCHRRILDLLGMHYLAKEENLNLLSAGDLHRMAEKLNTPFQIHSARFLGHASNLLLLLEKTPR